MPTSPTHRETAPRRDALPDLEAPVRPQDVGVVVCAYTLDRWDDLVASVTSLLGQDEPVGEVVVVIDHNPELLARAQERWPQLAVVPNAGAQGLSGARDTGVAATTSPVVAFLDDDAAAAPDWSGRLADAYFAGPVLGVGGHIEPAWPAGRPTWWPPEFDWVVGCSYRGLPTRRSPVRNSIGANMSFRRSVLEHVGGFEGSIGRVGTRPTGGEETELCIRARGRFPGAEVVHEPAAVVRHRVTPERATLGYFRRRCLGEGLTKVQVGRLSTHDEALSSERAYVLRTLPTGVLRGLASRDPRRGVMVVLGLAWTGWGYLAARVRA
ncbi:glycosyltransferase family 2 protein [Motilibacter aurantiacus]|uniref:glycosyltransferase family 2 protein n=1 Tax=Motilibacter aurantiacus TaxID=2714955 RepID=UPI001409C258|nr:glycosyltransferase family 2 protein [Motilibacter aurantiacus]NHC44714.1 glycosyltransferase family 2 protein [Motilibacter aurantiacus]